MSGWGAYLFIQPHLHASSNQGGFGSCLDPYGPRSPQRRRGGHGTSSPVIPDRQGDQRLRCDVRDQVGRDRCHVDGPRGHDRVDKRFCLDSPFISSMKTSQIFKKQWVYQSGPKGASQHHQLAQRPLLGSGPPLPEAASHPFFSCTGS